MSDEIKPVILEEMNAIVDRTKPAVFFFDTRFNLFHYPGGLGYELNPDGEVHEIKEANDRGPCSVGSACEWYCDLLRLHKIGNDVTVEQAREYIQENIGKRADELIQRCDQQRKGGYLPEHLR